MATRKKIKSNVKTKPDHKLATRIVRLMNEALELDYRAIKNLINTRVDCGYKLSNHPTIQVGRRRHFQGYTVGLLGLLNGLCGVHKKGKLKGMGLICVVEGNDGSIECFAETGTRCT